MMSKSSLGPHPQLSMPSRICVLLHEKGQHYFLACEVTQAGLGKVWLFRNL